MADSLYHLSIGAEPIMTNSSSKMSEIHHCQWVWRTLRIYINDLPNCLTTLPLEVIQTGLRRRGLINVVVDQGKSCTKLNVNKAGP